MRKLISPLMLLLLAVTMAGALSAQEMGSSSAASPLKVLSTEIYQGTECYRLLSDQGLTGFFSLTTGEMISPWFRFISFRKEEVAGVKAYRVQTADGNWTFINPATGLALVPTVDYLSPGRVQREDGTLYYQAESEDKKVLLAVSDGTVRALDGSTLSAAPSEEKPKELPGGQAETVEAEEAAPAGKTASETADDATADDEAADDEAAAPAEASVKETAEESKDKKAPGTGEASLPSSGADYAPVDQTEYTIKGETALLVERKADLARAFLSQATGKIITDWFLDISPTPFTFIGTPALAVLDKDQGQAFMAKSNGKIISPWYVYIREEEYTVADDPCVKVGSALGKVAFLSLETGTYHGGWFNSISNDTYTLAGKDYYLVKDTAKGEAFLSAYSGMVAGSWYTKIYPDLQTLGDQSYYAVEHPEKGFGYIPVDTGVFTQD